MIVSGDLQKVVVSLPDDEEGAIADGGGTNRLYQG